MLCRSPAPRVLVLGLPRSTVAHLRTDCGQLCLQQGSLRQKRGNHRLSWRKEKRTRMEIASSQRRRCLLREECEEAWLVKKQCAVDEKSNERSPCATWKEVGLQPTFVAPCRADRERVRVRCAASCKRRCWAFARPRAMLWTESVREVRRHLLSTRFRLVLNRWRWHT